MLKEAGRKCSALNNERAVGRETSTKNCSAEVNVAPNYSVYEIDCFECQVNSGDISRIWVINTIDALRAIGYYYPHNVCDTHTASS